MEINSPDQLGLGRVRRALNEVWDFFVIIAIVLRHCLLIIEIGRRLNVLCASSAGVFEHCSVWGDGSLACRGR